MDRVTATSLGLAVGVISSWAFTISTGIAPPPEVASAWGVVCMSVVGILYSKWGP
jgi:predicted MFS family arabinose efflux permease